jgi:hypothetical protein
MQVCYFFDLVDYCWIFCNSCDHNDISIGKTRWSEMDLTRAGNAIRLHPADNIAVAVRKLLVGAVLPNNVTAREPIPSGHKIAIAPVAPVAAKTGGIP